MYIPVTSAQDILIAVSGPPGFDFTPYPVQVAIIGEQLGEPQDSDWQTAVWDSNGVAKIPYAKNSMAPGMYMAWVTFATGDENPVIPSGRIRIGDGGDGTSSDGSPYAGTVVASINGETGIVTLDLAGGDGSGSVTSVAVESANGFAGTVADDTTTPQITLETTATGMLKGAGGAIEAAGAGADYLAPNGSGAALTGITAAQVDADASGLASQAQTNAETYAVTQAANALAAAIAASLPTLTEVSVSASGTLALDKITEVTAATALTMTLPASAANSLIVVERAAASTANVAVTGNIRGSAGTTVTLQLGSESEMFLGEGTTWWPIAGHKTLSSLQALFLQLSGGIMTANIGVPLKTVTTTNTTLATDWITLCNASAGGFTDTLPDATVVKIGASYMFKKTDTTANEVQLQPVSSQTVDGAPYCALAAPNATVTLISDGSNWWVF